MQNYRGYDRYAPYQAYRNQGSLVNFNTYTPEFIGKPVDDIRSMVETQSNNNKAIIDKTSAVDLALSNLDINPLDEQYRIEQQGKFKQGIQDIQNSDYGMIEANVNRMARDFQTNKALQASVENQAAYNTNRTKAEELYYKGFMSDAQFKDALAQEASPTTKIGDGIYSKFQPNQYVKKYDYDKDFSDYTKGFTQTERRLGYIPITDSTGNVIGYKERTVKGYNLKILKEQLLNIAESNPEMKAYMEEEARLNGMDYNTFVESEAEKYTQQKSGDSILDNNTLWKPSKTTSTDAYNPYGALFYGIPSLINQDHSDITNALIKKVRSGVPQPDPDYPGTYSPGTTGATIAGIDYFNPFGNNKSIEDTPATYDLGSLSDERLSVANNMAYSIGGMQGMMKDDKQIEDINQLSSSQKDKVFANIIKFYEQVEKSRGDEATANVSWMDAIDNIDEADDATALLTGNKQGKIINADGQFNASILTSNLRDGGFGKFVDFETNDLADMKDVLGELEKGATARVLGYTNYTNPVSSIVNNYGFSKSAVIQIGDKTFYMAMPEGNAQYINKPDVEKGKMYSSYYSPGQTKKVEINGKSHSIVYDEIANGFIVNDDKALMADGNEPIVFPNIEALYNFYLTNNN